MFSAMKRFFAVAVAMTVSVSAFSGMVAGAAANKLPESTTKRVLNSIKQNYSQDLSNAVKGLMYDSDYSIFMKNKTTFRSYNETKTKAWAATSADAPIASVTDKGKKIEWGQMASGPLSYAYFFTYSVYGTVGQSLKDVEKLALTSSSAPQIKTYISKYLQPGEQIRLVKEEIGAGNAVKVVKENSVIYLCTASESNLEGIYVAEYLGGARLDSASGKYVYYSGNDAYSVKFYSYQSFALKYAGYTAYAYNAYETSKYANKTNSTTLPQVVTPPVVVPNNNTDIVVTPSDNVNPETDTNFDTMSVPDAPSVIIGGNNNGLVVNPAPSISIGGTTVTEGNQNGDNVGDVSDKAIEGEEGQGGFETSSQDDETPGIKIKYETDNNVTPPSGEQNESNFQSQSTNEMPNSDDFFNVIGDVPSDGSEFEENRIDPVVTITASAQPAGGVYTYNRSVVLTSSMSGAKIYYTTNGDIPSANSILYTGAISITKNTNLKFVAIADDGTESGIFEEEYIINKKNTALPSRKVKFESNGGSSVPYKNVVQGSRAPKVEAPTKKGYVFDGWYTDKNFTREYDFNKAVTSDITLYAKWVVDETTQIVLRIGDRNAKVFGRNVQNDVAPMIVKERTMLPIRFLAEALGAEVEWDERDFKVTVTKQDKKIIIHIDSAEATVNGDKVRLDSPAFLKNGRTYLPLRFISENLGANVQWVESTQEVIITK